MPANGSGDQVTPNLRLRVRRLLMMVHRSKEGNPNAGGSNHVLRSFLSPSVLPVTRLGGVFLTHRPTFGKMFLFIENTHTHYVKVFFCLLLLLLLSLLFCSVAFLLLFVGCVLPPRRKHVHIRSRKRMKRNREAEHA